jgi:hypothetical protein
LTVVDICVSVNTSHLLFVDVLLLGLPLDLALDFTLEVRWVLVWDQGHFDVQVRVWLKLS